MIASLFIISMGILNALRGSGLFIKLVWYALMAITIGLYAQMYYFIPLFFITLWAGFSPGWGKYFNCAYTNITYIDEKEFLPIDWLTDKIMGKPVTYYQFQHWCFVAMSFRGLLLYPVFVVLAYKYPQAYGYGFIMAEMGLIYLARGLVPEKYSIRIAEFFTGCLIGGIVVLSVYGV